MCLISRWCLLRLLKVQVPECIEKLAQAGIKLWVLTGDKMETAVNIGYINKTRSWLCFYGSFTKLTLFYPSLPFYRYACSLLRQDMKQIVITLNSPDILSLEKQENKEVLVKVHNLVSLGHQIFSHYFLDLWYNDCLGLPRKHWETNYGGNLANQVCKREFY